MHSPTITSLCITCSLTESSAAYRWGHFRYGPYEIHDILCNSAEMRARRADICAAVLRETPGSTILHFMGEPL